MADLSGLKAYQAALQTAQTSIAGGSDDTAQAGGVNFAGLVTDAIAETEATMQHSEQMMAAGATGDADLVDVVTAVSAAELTLETVVSVRDQVVRAYQEILRMPI
ncbi:flagellar hook-basal body complex protein FliE [Maricaulis sp. D1M11]|uniref:flagellar hook-basal body complex protein FliE n=1 Tax=Maricaulis sp. D1M11 TaxID=3076117 RepID=UPI0039B6B8EA